MRVKQLSVFLENRKGSLAAMAQLLGGSGINMLALSIAETDNFGICRLIVSNAEEGVRILRATPCASPRCWWSVCPTVPTVWPRCSG